MGSDIDWVRLFNGDLASMVKDRPKAIATSTLK
jgi:hypothetical protein